MNKNGKWKLSYHIMTSMVITVIATLSDLLISGGSLPYIMHWFGNGYKSRGIGIIGGADGPTAIFLSGNPWFYFLITKLIFLCILLIMYLPTRKFLNKIFVNDQS